MKYILSVPGAVPYLISCYLDYGVFTLMFENTMLQYHSLPVGERTGPGLKVNP